MWRKLSSFLLVASGVGICHLGTCQDLHIFYDVEQQKTQYLSGNDTLIKAKVRAGDNIFYHLRNYNNYLYEVEITVKSKEESKQSLASGLGGLENMLFGGFSPFNLSGGSSLGDMMGPTGDGMDDLGGFNFGGRGFGTSAEELENAEELESLRKEFLGLLRDLDKRESQMVDLQQRIEKLYLQLKMDDLALQEIYKVRQNPGLSPQQIKSISLEYMEVVFGKDPTQEVELNDLLKKEELRTKMSSLLNGLKKEYAQYNRLRAELTGIGTRSGQYAFSSPKLDIFRQTLTEVSENSAALSETLDKNLSAWEEDLQSFQDGYMEKLLQLRYAFEELKSNKFAHTYQTTANGENMEISARLIPKDSLALSTTVSTREVAPVKVQIAGGLKINASLGISFGQFFDSPASYFVRDGLILAEEKDSFFPILTSFFQFYRQSAGNVSFGGAFGIGVPLANRESVQSATFFLGPSFVFGNNGRIVLSTGLMGGQVERLTLGYQVGDGINTVDGLVPTKNQYELGYFLALSFNLVQ